MDQSPQPNPPAPETAPPGTVTVLPAQANPYARARADAAANFQTALGDAWQNKLSPSEQLLTQDVLGDYTALLLDSIVSAKLDPLDVAQIEAQLAGIKSIEFDRLKHYAEVAAGRAVLGGIASLLPKIAPFLL